MAHRLAWPSKRIRQTFLDFFTARDHKYVPSSSVIPRKGQGTYFVNAGMNQVFKKYNNYTVNCKETGVT